MTLENSDQTAPTAAVSNPQAGGTGEESQNKLQFPWKLHQLLDEADQKGYDGIISWMPDGKSFKVHDKTKFEREVMPIYFECKFSNYCLWLMLWEFLALSITQDYRKTSD